MRIIKLGVISAIVFSLLLLGFSALIPSTIRVSRAVNIEAPRTKVEIIVAADESWNELAGNEPRGNLRFHQEGNITVVQWYFDFRLKWYPWEKFGAITIDKQIGPYMERSLKNLKELVEKSP